MTTLILIFMAGLCAGWMLCLVCVTQTLRRMMDDTLSIRGEDGGLLRYMQAKKTLEAFGGKAK